jgi:hypothetical protein
MCSVPTPKPIAPLITFDPTAGKAARVRTGATQKRSKKKKSGLRALTAPAAGGSISDLLQTLTIGPATVPAQ